MAVWLHGCMIVEMYERMYGLVTDGVWVCMSVGMALNDRIEVNIIDANATTTTTDQNQRRQEAHAQE